MEENTLYHNDATLNNASFVLPLIFKKKIKRCTNERVQITDILTVLYVFTYTTLEAPHEYERAIHVPVGLASRSRYFFNTT